MDHKFTNLIKEWLDTPEAERDYNVGAMYLLKLSGNAILYRNIVANLDGRRQHIEYQLQKYYNFRVQDLTRAQVAEMETQVANIAAEHSLVEQPKVDKANEPKQLGKRDDHDSLPDEIKAKFVENLSVLQRCK